MSRLVVVSNRVAPIREGKAVAGGLAVGVHDALRKAGGIWFGWSGEISATPALTCEAVGNITYATLGLTRRDYDHYYRGFSNATLWPTLHYRIDLARFSREEYDGYRRVNRLLAEQLLPLLRADDVIWVHDYHLIPFAEELRELGVRNRIGFFLHIPFPAPEILTVIPPHNELLKTLCSYDLIGFQTEVDRTAFEDYIQREVRGVRGRNGLLTAYGRHFCTGVYPIGVMPDEIQEQASASRGRCPLSHHAPLGGQFQTIISVDRLDYSKGLVERFAAYEELLDRYAEHRRHVQFVQIAPTSRSDVKTYQHIRHQLETQAGHINGRYAELDWMPLHYLNKSHERRMLMGLYRASAVGLVTPLRDGMNLVAKEYVAAQDPDDPGVLVLSRFAGAAREMHAALIVNPYDRVGMAEAMDRALRMSVEERRERHSTLMNVLRRNDLSAWRDGFLGDLQRSNLRPPQLVHCADGALG